MTFGITKPNKFSKSEIAQPRYWNVYSLSSAAFLEHRKNKKKKKHKIKGLA